jgi:hypothetical protein
MDKQITPSPKKEVQPKIEVGMGATICGWSDKHACTVIKVEDDGKRVTVQQDKATRTDKNYMSECQEYTYEPDPQGSIYTFTIRKNGRFTQVGSAMGKGMHVYFGGRREWYDYSF